MKIGIQELLVVFIVALVVIGPDKLPYYAKKLGQAVGQFRKYTEEATKDIRESIVEPLNEAQKPLREAMEPVTELEKDIRHNVNDIKKSLSEIGRPDKDESRQPDTASLKPENTPACAEAVEDIPVSENAADNEETSSDQTENA